MQEMNRGLENKNMGVIGVFASPSSHSRYATTMSKKTINIFRRSNNSKLYGEDRSCHQRTHLYDIREEKQNYIRQLNPLSVVSLRRRCFMLSRLLVEQDWL